MPDMAKTEPDSVTRTFTVKELDALDIGPWNCLANYEGDTHRWYTVRHLVFEHEGRHWMVDYMDPASEGQEDQSRWTGDDDADGASVVAVEVRKVPVIVEQWQPAADPVD